MPNCSKGPSECEAKFTSKHFGMGYVKMHGFHGFICVFMNINENFSNERKHLRKIKGCTYKITYVSNTMCSSVSNLSPIQCLDIVPLP